MNLLDAGRPSHGSVLPGCKYGSGSYIIYSMEHEVIQPDKTAGQNTKSSRLDPSFDSLFDRIVNSETFRAAPVMRRLLLHLWRHQGESISEYAIAVDALGRPPEFDPKGDATVRVGIARLRAKLKEFYEREVESAPFQLTIPLGGHEIRWVQGAHRSSHFSIIWALPVLYRNILLVSITLGTLLAVLCITLVLENHTLKESHRAPPPELPRFWRSFLAGGKGSTIVVPTPLFVRWPERGVFVRDIRVTQFQDWTTSQLIRQVAGRWGPPKLAEPYIPAGSVKAAVKMQRYLENHGQQPEFTDSPNLAADTASGQNTIFLGAIRGYASNDRVKQILERTNFYAIKAEPTVMGNRHPAHGEAAEYHEVDFSTEHKVLPELVMLLPVTSNGTRTLLLIGQNTSVFNLLLTSPDGLKLVDQQWMEAGFPDSWEMVIQAEINGEKVLRLQPLAIRKIQASFWK
jgi:hypothetical protein